MTVDQKRGSGHESGIHAIGFFGIYLDEHKAMPVRAVPFGIGPQFAQEDFFEFQDFFHVHAGNEGLSSSVGGVGEQDIFEFVAAGRKDRGAFVDFRGIEQVEDGEVLDLEDFVHALNAEAAFLVEEVGDMGLFESSLLRQSKAGEFACFDPIPEDLTKIILQDFELHRREYSTGK